MKLCNTFQAQLLENLYGLLDDAERHELEDHLTQCGECRQALDQARKEQVLLAAAARKEFPEVRFAEPPVPATTEEEMEPRTIPVSSGWFRWGVAAAILFGLVGLGLPAGLYSAQQDRVASARNRMERVDAAERAARARADQANQELLAIEREIHGLQNDRAVEVNKVRQAAAQKPLRMTVSGPRTPDPGAVNTYQIQIRSRVNAAPVPANLTIKVTDEKGKVLHQVEEVKIGGDYQLVLPRDLPLKPNTELALEVSARAANGMQGSLKEKLRLVAPVYLTHLTTDKPMYQPGQSVHFRSLTLERFSLRPASEDLELIYTITKPDGSQAVVLNALSRVADSLSKESLRGPDGKPIQGVGAGDWKIELGTPGGEYTLSVRDARSRILPQERKFIVNVYEKPRLNKELELTKKSYGPGEKVEVSAKAMRAEGGAVANQPVNATLNVDGQNVPPLNPNLKTDGNGAVQVAFQLPKEIAKGEASVSITFSDGGSVDTIVRPVPLVLSKLEVEFFPEGGDLVAGVPNRVYFQARTTLGKPAELKGRILDDSNAVACDVQTFNDANLSDANHGMGAFSFTPLEGKKYRLQVDVPSGITALVGPKNSANGQFLPPVKADGVVLTALSGVSSDREPIQLAVRSGRQDRQLLVGAYCRGRLMDHQRVAVKKGQAALVELRPESGIGGVYRVTVFDEREQGGRTDLVPVAERLIYREPSERLNLSVSTDKQRFVPGEHITAHVRATDEKGNAAPAILMVAAVDRSVLKLADEKTHKSLPTHFLLATEVRRPEDLEHADFLISPTRSAHIALDLLLGTQGWRRFVEQTEKPVEYRARHQEKDIDRLLVLNGQLLPEMLAPQATSPEVQAAEAVVDRFGSKFEPLQKRRLTAVEKKSESDEAATEAHNRLEGDKGERALATQAYQTEVVRLQNYQGYLSTTRLIVVPTLMLALLVLGIVMLVKGVIRADSALAVPYLVTSVCSLILFGMLGLFLVAGGMQTISTVAQNLAGAPQRAAGAKAMEAGDVGGGPGGGGRNWNGAKAGVDEADRDLLRKAVPMEEAAKAPGAPVPAPVPMMALPQKPAAKIKQDDKLANLERGEGKGAEFEKRAAGANRPVAAQAGQARREAKERQAFGARGHLQADQPMMNMLKDAAADGKKAGPFADRMDALNEAALAALPPTPCLVREYAHHHSSTTPGVRSDFAETVFWHPVLVLPDGKTDIAFDLSDSVTTFDVYAAGHTLDGRLGAVTVPIESRLPLTIEPKLPTEVTSSDRIDVPVAIANNTDRSLGVTVGVSPTGLALLGGKASDRLVVDADRRTRRVYRLRPTLISGEASLRLDGSAGGVPGDSILRTLKVVPEGFPFVGAQSEMLESVARQDLVLPDSWVRGTLQYRVTVYPSTLASLQKGLEGLLREPCGCFEQTSTSNYPNLLILDYLKTTDQANPQAERRARELLDRGYQKLTSFECTDTQKNQKRGYEWFGGTAPAHEALTAYGLMQFRDMTRVYDVDKTMVQRTTAYLMAQRDGQGGFKRNPRALDTFGRAPDHITSAYIVWALTEGSKDDDVTKELDAAFVRAEKSKDPYFLALVANALMNRNRAGDAVALLETLKDKQQADGHLDAEQTSITGSGGRDLQIETTALSLLAWLKAQRPDKYNGATQKAVEWIGKQRGGYGAFGSTQSTILALKALIAFAAANKKTAEAGELVLFADNKEVARQAFPAGASDAIVLELKDADRHLKAGKNALRVEITGKSVFPYTAVWSYRTLKPASADKAPVRVTTKLDRTDLKEGETGRLTVTAENVSGKGQGMAVAIVGIPGGMTIPEDLKQLKDLAKLRNDGTERGPIDFFEIRGRELVLYWRDMAPGKKVEVNLDLIARVPGEYRGPASRGYLYYNADHKHWVDPIQVVIEPRGAE